MYVNVMEFHVYFERFLIRRKTGQFLVRDKKRATVNDDNLLLFLGDGKLVVINKTSCIGESMFCICYAACLQSCGTYVRMRTHMSWLPFICNTKSHVHSVDCLDNAV